MSNSEKFLWWQTGTIYQIYPRSFRDSNGDGIGDLNGIREKLGYLQDLGVKGIWISPIYPSPMADFGYDVSDYTGIHPMFGTMDEFEALLEEIHQRDMKLILDLVPNHSSDQHPWFQESRQSRDNPKSDWYLWKDPKPDGSPPNNWLSEFGGGAWEYEPKREQYYYHAYLKEQPDLNWRNPEVREAMFEVMRFWMNKGVDGFRVDVMWHMIKDQYFRDNPPNPNYNPSQSPYHKLIPAYSTDQYYVHNIVKMMRSVTDEFPERVLIGEIYLPIHRLVSYYGMDNTGAHLPFNIQLIKLPWDARAIEAAVNEYEGALPADGWPNWVLGNHDNSRVASRIGHNQARIAAIMLLTLRGTPTMYYGDEIGMTDVPISAEDIKDPQEKNVPGKGLGRDPERTPMQWDSSKYAGFSEAKPWLPVAENFDKVNVESQSAEKNCMLQLYRRLIKLRNEEPALHSGRYVPIYTEGTVLAYVRVHGQTEFLIVLNLSGNSTTFSHEITRRRRELVISSHSETEKEHPAQGAISLMADEGLVFRLLKDG